MKKITIASAVFALGLTSSCATGHAVRYAYGESSWFLAAEDDDAWRAVYAAPVIVGSIVFDAVTFPFQAVFGVWPWWGDKSVAMDPAKLDD